MAEFDDRQLIISTPEQVSLDFPLAGIGSRFMAFLIDSLIQGLCFLVVGLLLAIIGITLGRAVGTTWAIAVLVILVFLIYWGYFAFFEALWGGQTPGKRVVGIRVVKDSGRAIKFTEAASRNLMRAIDSLPGVYLFGLITMLISPEKKRLGDYVAGTVVVHEKSAVEVYPDLQKLDDTTPVPNWTTKLNDRDLQLIESFLHRRITLEQGVRLVTAMRIVEHVNSRTGEPKPPGLSDEEYLESVANAIRNSRGSH
jgi:uncharacterized RDD family membrane protein YckC